jgi:hypothetical protein
MAVTIRHVRPITDDEILELSRRKVSLINKGIIYVSFLVG